MQVTTILNILEDISTMCTIKYNTLQISLIPLSQNSIKTKKCHSEARDRPDLIQTAPVPGGGLVRQKIKINRTKKIKIPKSNYSSNGTLAKEVKQIKLSTLSPICIKTKKCQSNAGDRPDIIQTAPVPSIGLARQKI